MRNPVAATVTVVLVSYIALVVCEIVGWRLHDPFHTPSWCIYIIAPTMSAIIYSAFRKPKT